MTDLTAVGIMIQPDAAASERARGAPDQVGATTQLHLVVGLAKVSDLKPLKAEPSPG